jgi:hypothetical protein
MSDRGVFAVDRRIFDHPVFALEPFTEREAWIWMIGAAAWKPQRVRVGHHVISLERGQLAFSTRFLATKFKWSHGKIIRFLKRLETETMVSTLATRETTQITICNYNKYAFGRNTGDTQTETQNDTLAVHSRYKEEERKEKEREDERVAVATPSIANQTITVKRKRTERRATPWPDGFALNDEMRAFAAEHGWTTPTRQNAEFEKYHQHALQTGRTLKDWVAGWRSWVLKGTEYDRCRPNAAPAPTLALAAPSIDWEPRVAKFKLTGLWPLPWGPRPDCAGCSAPADALARHGYGRAPSNRVTSNAVKQV